MVSLLRFFFLGGRKAPRATIALVFLLSVVSGVCHAGVMVVISTLLGSSEGSLPLILLGFVGLCLLMASLRFTSNLLLARLTHRTQLELSLELSRNALRTPLRQLEQIGAARLLAALTDDLNTIAFAFTSVPLLVMHVTVVAGALAYMGWLSPPLLLVVLGFLAVGVFTYQLPMRYAQRHFQQARARWDELVKHFRGVVDGAKELKIHARRRHEFVVGGLAPAAEGRRRHQVAGAAAYAGAASWGQTLAFMLIGLLFFLAPQSATFSREDLTGFVLAILFMLTPVEVILGQMPVLARANVALRNIEKLGLSLKSQPADSDLETPAETPGSWRHLAVAGATHSYRRQGEPGVFTLGPVDLSFTPGELVFVTGGNGSGKTTLAKLLLGLYVPEEGEILLDGEPVTDADRERYRQLFSVVFSDFFLFQNLPGIERADLDRRARHHLEQLQLEQKVEVRDGALTTLDLSQGQRKRLALLAAYLEDRPIFLFDEWAADQDPHFKEIFYRSLLPELRASGKTVIVISHDDAYYDAADRIISLRDGQVEYDGLPSGRRPALQLATAPSRPA